jgi:response regulator of citrate/malate metabolism
MEVKYVTNIYDARLILLSFTPSVIFLDNHLPDGLGIEFAKYLSTEFPESRIIIITAKETNPDHAFKNGASEIIFKPFTTDKIFSVLKKYS